MRKATIFLIFAGLILSFAVSSKAQTSRAKKSKLPKSEKIKPLDERGCRLASYTTIGKKTATVHYNCAADVEKLNLSRTGVHQECAYKETKCEDETHTIEISVETSDAENDVLTYVYKINGGKITGVGSKVVWDLSGVQPGIYKITAGADDGLGIGKTITKEVSVSRCEECARIADIFLCPKISIAADREDVKEGEIIVFTATVEQMQDFEPSYKWTISGGEIIDGQNTPTIMVQAAYQTDKDYISAAVEIEANASILCDKSALKTVKILKP